MLDYSGWHHSTMLIAMIFSIDCHHRMIGVMINSIQLEHPIYNLLPIHDQMTYMYMMTIPKVLYRVINPVELTMREEQPCDKILIIGKR